MSQKTLLAGYGSFVKALELLLASQTGERRVGIHAYGTEVLLDRAT